MVECEIYVNALVAVIIKVILRNARCNNKDTMNAFLPTLLLIHRQSHHSTEHKRDM